MEKMRFRFPMALGSPVLLVLCACSSNGAEEMEATFGTAGDVDRADQLWSEIDGYRNWERLAGTSGFVESGAPHGAFVRVFQNEVAGEDVESLADGSIVIKENFGEEDEETLGAITVMKRIEGYSPDTGNWFYAKYLPDGSLDENAAGVPLAGSVGEGGSEGCVPCHAGATGGDYVFGN